MSILPASEVYSTLQQNPHSSPESSYADRLASFTAAWPHASPTPQDLARAGLSHRPTKEHPDNVICKECKDYLCDWKADHDPKIQLHIEHYRCSSLWLVLPTTDRKMPSASDIGFFDPSLQYDFPDLCLFQNVKIFCNRIRRLKFFETDILDLLPKCLRGEALIWLNQSKHWDLAACLGAMRARFWQAPPEAPPGAPPQAQQAPLKAPQAPPEGPPEAPQAPPEAPPRAPDYHNCKLCNASFSSIARLIRHTQENICNKPPCRHCETVFSSKNQLHRHLREECRKQTRSSSASSSRSSSRSSFKSSSQSSTACSSTCSPISSPAPSPASSPHLRYQAISPSPPSYLTVADLSARFAKPPYLKVDDLFRMFGPRSASTKSSITIASDDPFARPFVLLKKSMGSTQTWELGLATSRHQIAQAQCSAPRSICERCRSPLFDIDKRHAMPDLA